MIFAVNKFYNNQGESEAWAVNQYRQDIRLHCQVAIQLVMQKKLDDDSLDRGIFERLQLLLEIVEPLEEAYFQTVEQKENDDETVSV